MSLPRLLPILLVFVLTACASDPEQPAPLPPTLVNLQLESGALINPDASGKAAPVLLRIYELREHSNFAGADFFALFDKEQATLAGELLRKQELLIKPGETKILPIEPGADTRFLGFFAAFRKLDNAQWRNLATLKLHQTNSILLKIEGNTLAVKESEPEAAPVADK